MDKLNSKVIFWSLFIYIVVVVLYALVVPCSLSKPKSPGEFGDMFGALNAIFAGLGFMGLLANLYMQHAEIKRLRNDFEIEQKKRKEEIENRYVACLKSIRNELQLYLEKIKQLHSEIETAISTLENKNLPPFPTYNIYLHLLENLQLKLVEFEIDDNLLRSISVHHYELSHIKNRLQLYISSLSSPPRYAMVPTGEHTEKAVWNYDCIQKNAEGFKSLLERSLKEFPITIGLTQLLLAANRREAICRFGSPPAGSLV